MSSSVPSEARPPVIGRALTLGVISVCMAAGCAVGPDFERPAPPPVAAYERAGSPPVASGAVNDALADRWWEIFRSPALSAAVEAALEGNQTLASAVENLRESQDSLRAGYGLFLPTVGADLGGARQRLTPLRFGEAGPASVFNLFTASGTISYLVDLFGGSRRQLEALVATVDYERASAKAAYLTVTSNMATTTIALAGYRGQLSAGESLADAAALACQVTTARVAAGVAPYSAQLAAQQQLAEAEQALAATRFRVEQAQHLQAALAGRAPVAWQPAAIALEAIGDPGDLPLSLPSELVRQRPDILVAEARLHVASANVGIATAAMFPHLTLSAAAGRDALTPGALTRSGGEFWSAGADLSVPVLNGGQLYYQRREAVDLYRAAAADYRQVVLAALQQVADALQALARDATVAENSAAAARAAATTLQLVESNYAAGTTDFLAVLADRVNYESAESVRIGAIAQQRQDVVALVASLGGGWRLDPEAMAGAAQRRTK